MRPHLIAAAAVAVVAGGYFLLFRGYPLALAILMAIAAGALAFSVGRTTARLRRMRRR